MVKNLTQHEISLANEAGEIVATYPASGVVAKLATSQELVGEIDSAPVRRTVFGGVSGLPTPEEGVFLLVGTLVAQAAGRPDVISPDTGPTAVRKDGQVVAVRGFQAFA